MACLSCNISHLQEESAKSKYEYLSTQHLTGTALRHTDNSVADREPDEGESGTATDDDMFSKFKDKHSWGNNVLVR